MNYYNQLAGALGVLKQNSVPLDYAALDKKLRQIAASHGPDQCDTPEIKSLHRQYRDLCLSHGYIQQGELFNQSDCIPLL